MNLKSKSLEMYYAISNVAEILIEESKSHIDSKEAVEQIREEMNVINKISLLIKDDAYKDR